MEIDTDYAVQVFFPTSAFPQVYFEAVANSFDAGASEIVIDISTDGSINPERLEIMIRDNGIGFTDERFQRFSRLQKPQDKYHKGLGRLVYLQYFERVEVESIYGESRRTFTFSPAFRGESSPGAAPANAVRATTLRFRGFQKDRLKSYNDLKPSEIKLNLLAHFLPLLFSKVRTGEEFRITIRLDTAKPNPQHEFFSDVVELSSKDVPAFETRHIDSPDFGAFSSVEMSYFIRDDGSKSHVLTAVSVDNRTVPVALIPPRAVPAGITAIFLFESDLFQGRSDSARQRLDLPETVNQASVYRTLRDEMAAVLAQRVPEIEERNEKTLTHFEERYPHLVGLFDQDVVGVIDRDEALRTAQLKFFQKQKDVLEAGAVDDETFSKSLELSSRTLTEYILYRQMIIDRLSASTAVDAEETIHSLIVPRYKTYDGKQLVDGVYSNNAWILDDKFMAFRTILSEARMDAVIDAIRLEGESLSDASRPDISMIFSADPHEPEPVDVVVVEVKRRESDDKEGPYANTQLLKRARKIIDHCYNVQRMWYFGIIEIDDDLQQYLLDDGWTPLYSRGRVFYRERELTRASDGKVVPTPICLLSYDAVVEDASVRNHTFLELLKADLRAKLGAHPED